MLCDVELSYVAAATVTSCYKRISVSDAAADNSTGSVDDVSSSFSASLTALSF